jgi:4-carboxymuconolactone decarboxylase
MDEKERHKAGMEVRRQVLGHPHVDRASAQTIPLTGEFQDLITRYAWGEIWTRPGLDIHSRPRHADRAWTVRGVPYARPGGVE